MRFVRFVLSDLPLPMRQRAAWTVADGLVRELKRDMLDRHVSEAAKLQVLAEAIVAMREATHPRDRAEYFVPAETWIEMVGKHMPGGKAAAKRRKRQKRSPARKVEVAA